ncbi:MAG: murein L,D-transpeptidase catalytic domain family protein [Bacteroidia bacterium]|nr:murein L,D-transpeptidase catalytic domain family protein [Bacteroidia bacterium]
MISWLFVLVACHGSEIKHEAIPLSLSVSPPADLTRTRQHAREALVYCRANRLDTTRCILIDMGLHAGVKRLLVWEFAGDSIGYRALVSHGSGDNPWSQDVSRENPTFSNVPGSYCSSLGRYRIGARGYSNWGIHVKYLLHGLDSTNTEALARDIVFHGWDMIPDEEVWPRGAPEGHGCPAVSNRTMTYMDSLLQTHTQPVLMWVYR